VCLYPRDDRTWTARTFLRQDLPDAYAAGWEELFWRDEPFAFHLRQVGRSIQGRQTARDADLVARAVGCYRGEVRG
jgi:hypothetical protein